VNGRHYIFISVEEFQALVKRNAFLESGNRGRSLYGTLRFKEAEKIMSSIGKAVVAKSGDNKYA
jgi:guanylate kinase